MTVRIITADVLDGLTQLKSESIHCVVTSPPYWGLRDYGTEGQIGLEPTSEAYVTKMVEVFREVRRVLCKDGTLWLNLGDCYVTSPPGNKPNTTALSSGLPNSIENQEMRRAAQARPRTFAINDQDGAYKRRMERQLGGDEDIGAIYGDRKVRTGLKPKDLCGIPWRVAFALQADGWWLRQDIIWSKPNPMPESIKDRCTKAHEYLFLLAKSERYYFDAEAIAEPSIYQPDGTMPAGWMTGPGSHGTIHADGRRTHSERERQKGYYAGRWANGGGVRDDGSFKAIRETRNKRSVWEVTTQPYSEAHFATFPPALIEPCIKAGSPEYGMVLDPFGGAGTTGLVADRLKRNAILIELNPDYAAMAEKRIKGDCPMFTEVATSCG